MIGTTVVSLLWFIIGLGVGLKQRQETEASLDATDSLYDMVSFVSEYHGYEVVEFITTETGSVKVELKEEL